MRLYKRLILTFPLLIASLVATAEELPAASELFARFAELSYGEMDSDGSLAFTVRAEILMQQFEVTVGIEIKQKAPGYRRVVGEVFGQLQRSGCTLSRCWEEGRDGFEIIEGDELQRWLEHADTYRWKHIDRYASSMETVGTTQWAGSEVYKVRLVDKFAQENFYYFDKDSGLLLASEVVVADLGGFESRTETYHDYRKYGPLLMAQKTVLEQPSITRVTTIHSVAFEDIPDSEFDPPESVKRMMSAQ